ncbi:ABC transporter G family member 23-like [Panonychus citri]|uniref:ABC transporter G family member 23-like n=1 Tax=Panonychus citri TaxID=50023 RepID=UPI002306FD38|nr:ABC transporter G family member 23-like [Panonychus citri]
MLMQVDWMLSNGSNQKYYNNHGKVSLSVKADCLKLELNSFGETHQVFKGLKLNVPSGTIFGLIGPSGCGKTTFFRTILGRYKVLSGNLQVLGVNLSAKCTKFAQLGSQIGYMPQDIALDQDLTVTETLYFYGCLNNLTSNVISDRSNQLMNILGFDNFSRKVCQLSIGQQRRLSLACALLHRPKLALLDEPTVGSDPMLVKRIWDYLKSATSRGEMTIIVSTHYLEEVRRADHFAFLSQGYVLFADNPTDFIKNSGSSTLEEAISSMYKIKMDESSDQPTVSLNTQPDTQSEPSSEIFQQSTVKLNQNQNFFHLYVWLLWRYKHRWMKHMIYRLIGVGLVHAMIITFCGLLYGHFPKDLSIGLINWDNSSSSLQYIDLLNENPNNWSFPLYSDERVAHRDVESGRLQGYLSIGSTFTLNLDQLMKLGLSENIDDSLLTKGFITLTQDTVNRLKADSVELTVYIYLNRLFKQLTQYHEIGDSVNKTYLSKLQYVTIEPLFKDNDRLKDLAPTNIILIKFFFQLIETITVGMIIIWVTREFHEPTVERLSASGVTRLHLTCALITITVLLLSPIIIMSCAILTMTTGFPVHGAWVFVVLVSPAIVIAGCAKAIWIGSIIPSTIFAILVTTSYGFIGIFTGSIFWPLEGLPYFMVPLRNIYPYTESGLSAVRAMIYGDSLWSPQVYGGLFYAWTQAIVAFCSIFLWFYIVD